jgi:hypothetical protein
MSHTAGVDDQHEVLEARADEARTIVVSVILRRGHGPLNRDGTC